MAATRSSASLASPTRRRASWPLYAVIGGAALVGSIAMVLVMRGPGDGHAATSAHASAPADAGASPAKPVFSVEPIEQAAALDASVPSPAASAPRPAAVTSPPAAVPAHPPAVTARAPEPVEARSLPAKPAATPPAVRHPDPSAREDQIARRFSAGQYEQVVEQCSGGGFGADLAAMCLLAACHASDTVRARAWLAAVPSAKRDALVASCRQLGVEVARKKPDKPAEDCETDLMACRH